MRLPIRATIKTVTIIILCLVLVPILSLAKVGETYNKHRIVQKGIVMATAYNSLENQTDSSPWITASGTRCKEGVIASNFLPFGTKLMIEGFGNQIFTVEDRMNRRYKRRIDIWFRQYKDARQFGIRKIKYYVVDA